MNSTNPHTAYYACLVLESVVKNCGAPMHDEVFTKENCTMLSQFLEQTTHDNVRAKMLELVQTWAYAFRNSERYQAIKVSILRMGISRTYLIERLRLVCKFIVWRDVFVFVGNRDKIFSCND